MSRSGQGARACAAFRAGALAVLAALTPQPGWAQTESADAEPPLRGVWYSGYDAGKGEHYFFSGGTVALNGDISRHGYFVRAYGSRVDYELDPGNGRGYQADLMLGYRVSYPKLDGGLYVGVDYQDYRLDPDDPTSEVRGTEWGVKFAGDLETPRVEATPYYALEGEYSTAFRTYWARARVGLTLQGVTFGPEAAALGVVSFDAQRLGGFLTFNWDPLPQVAPLEISLHAGHQFVSGQDDGPIGSARGGEGAYGGITLILLF